MSSPLALKFEEGAQQEGWDVDRSEEKSHQEKEEFSRATSRHDEMEKPLSRSVSPSKATGNFDLGVPGGKASTIYSEKQIKPNKVYVGGLPEHTRQEELQSCFGKIGRIASIELKSGFGFVEFADRQSAEESVAKYNGEYFMGNKIRVELSHGGGRSAKFTGDAGACFKCGQMGHWARECPNHVAIHRRHEGTLMDRVTHPPPRHLPPRGYPPPRGDYRSHREPRYHDPPPPRPPSRGSQDYRPRDYRPITPPPRDYRDHPVVYRSSRDVDEYRRDPRGSYSSHYDSRSGYYSDNTRQSSKRPRESSPVGEPLRKVAKTHHDNLSTLPQFRNQYAEHPVDQVVMEEAAKWGIVPPLDKLTAEIPMIVLCLAKALKLNMNLDETAVVLKTHKDYAEVFLKCFNSQNFEEIRNWPEFKKKEIDVVKQTDGFGRFATMDSWGREYIVFAACCLSETMAKYMTDEFNMSAYANFFSIVQSSGTGKSRMIDELSKKHIIIPVNLGKEKTEGYPPPDKEARDFLVDGSLNPMRQYHAYFTALFIIAERRLTKLKRELNLPPNGRLNREEVEKLAAEFRLSMAPDRKNFKKQGQERETFYRDVVTKAKELYEIAEEVASPEVSTNTLQKLTPSVSTSNDRPPRTPENPEVISPPRAVKFKDKEYNIMSTGTALIKLIDGEGAWISYPLIILSFDEAHTLADRLSKSAGGESFVSFRRVLRCFKTLPIFTVFLSTTSKIADFSPPAITDRSNRVSEGALDLFPPFTELGFDQLAKELVDGKENIDNVSKVDYMVKFGRPLFATRFETNDNQVKKDIVLFARVKLYGKDKIIDDPEKDPEADLACLSIRLPLQFISTTTATRKLERRMVSHHMRICLNIGLGLESSITVAPSEPILAEGARRHMLEKKYKYDLSERLQHHLEKSGLDKGNRGELIALVLLTLACDKAYTVNKASIAYDKGEISSAYKLLEFIDALFPSKEHATVRKAKPYMFRAEPNTLLEQMPTLEKTFASSRIYFNHFIKIQEFGVLNRKHLWKLIARGAAVLCADNQSGVDIVVPFLYRDGLLGRANISAIFIQVKNDSTYKEKTQEHLFHPAMDPFKSVKFFDVGEEPLPVIRMVFALASPEPAVKVLSRAERDLRSQGRDTYTAFDIWCAKLSDQTFGVVSRDQEPTYQRLLQISKAFPVAYEPYSEVDLAANLRKNMNPGTALDPQHWQFCKNASTATT